MRSLLFFALALFCATSTVSAGYVPVYVMMPLNTVTNNLTINNPDKLQSQLNTLAGAHVDGIMIDVWWGLVERDAPSKYVWTPYLQLISMARQANLKMHVIMSFHQCGGNVGDDCDIPLPPWVVSVGDTYPDIWYQDREGNINKEYISLGADDQNLFPPTQRTPVQMYHEFMAAFRASVYNGNEDVINEIQIGMGPAGELRYPSYPSAHWSFPGVGEFQCYDKYMLSQLTYAAAAAGHPEWGYGGPDSAGTYNSQPSNAPFFQDGTFDNYASAYGQFFLGWYTGMLQTHADNVLSQAHLAFSGAGATIAAKIAGVHWWYKTTSHAAELTAGYYNTNGNDGYASVAQRFARFGVRMDFTCLEMLDSEQNVGSCGPQELVAQTHLAANAAGISYSGENALSRYDSTAYNTIQTASKNNGYISSFNYLRLSDTLMQSGNFNTFSQFVNSMHNL